MPEHRRIQLLRQEAPVGAALRLHLQGRDSIEGVVLSYGDDYVRLAQNGLTSLQFCDDIAGFELLQPLAKSLVEIPASGSGRTYGKPSLPVDQAFEMVRQLEDAGELGEAGLAESEKLVERLAGLHASVPETGRTDPALRRLLIKAFKLVEHQRLHSLKLSRGEAESGGTWLSELAPLRWSALLWSLNEALRLGSATMAAHERFVDAYHLFKVVEPHRQIIETDVQTWQSLGRVLWQAWELQAAIKEDPKILATWRAKSFAHAGFFKRLANICQVLADYGFAGSDAEAEKLRNEALSHRETATRGLSSRTPVDPTGWIVSLDARNRGLIRHRDGTEVKFELDKVLDMTVRQALREGAGDIPVDFDVAWHRGKKLDIAENIREAGFFLAQVDSFNTHRGVVCATMKGSESRGVPSREVRFFFSALPDPKTPPPLGEWILGRYEFDPGRPLGFSSMFTAVRPVWGTGNFWPVEVEDEAPDPEPGRHYSDWASEFSQAQDEERFDDALALAETGLQGKLNPGVVLRYAKLLKTLGRPQDALAVYRRGMETWPGVAIIHEHAGIYAGSLQDHVQALLWLRQARTIAEADPRHTGLKSVLFALGRELADSGSIDLAGEGGEVYGRLMAMCGGPQKFVAPFVSRRDLEAWQKIQSLTQLKAALESAPGQALRIFESAGFKQGPAPVALTGKGWMEVRLLAGETALGKEFPIGGAVLLRCVLPGAPVEGQDPGLAALQESGQDETAIFLVAEEWSPDVRNTLPGTSGILVFPFTYEELSQGVNSEQTLRSGMTGVLQGVDLFRVSGPVKGWQFFGRPGLPEKLEETLERHGLAAIFGLGLSGKTSLLQKIKSRLVQVEADAASPSPLVLTVDFADGPISLAQRLQAAGGELARMAESLQHVAPGFSWQFCGRDDLPEDTPVAGMVEGMTADLGQLAASYELIQEGARPRLLLILDGLERAFEAHDDASEARRFIAACHRLQRAHPSSLWLLLAGSGAGLPEQLSQLFSEDGALPAEVTLHLPFLPADELTTMLQRLGSFMGLTFPDQVCTLLHEQTGGHPCISRQIGSLLRTRLGAGVHIVTPEDVMEAVHIFISAWLTPAEPGSPVPLDPPAFAQILRAGEEFPEEWETLRKMAGHDSSMPVELLERQGMAAPQHMVRCNLVHEESGRFSFGIRLLRDFLRRQSLPSMPPEPGPVEEELPEAAVPAAEPPRRKPGFFKRLFGRR